MYVAPPMRMGVWSMARVLQQHIEYYYHCMMAQPFSRFVAQTFSDLCLEHCPLVKQGLLHHMIGEGFEPCRFGPLRLWGFFFLRYVSIAYYERNLTTIVAIGPRVNL